VTGKVVARPTRYHEGAATFGHRSREPAAAATICGVKRLHRAWPKQIVEIPSKRPDPRADPHATQKISREQLDDALKRTKSGTRMRSEPDLNPRDSLPGPRDDSPEITIVRIDSVELSVFDPASFPPSADPIPEPTAEPAAAQVAPAEESSIKASPRTTAISLTRRLHITPQLAFLIGLVVVAFVTLAAIVGFFAGRISGH
jgi:hypothetical protein